MEYKIVLDSCGELTPEMKATGIFESVALSMQVGEETIVDDADSISADFLKKVAACSECLKSSCTSPERYMENYIRRCEAGLRRYTFPRNSADLITVRSLGRICMRKSMEIRTVYIFNSRSASVGETLIALKVLGM